MNYDISVDGHNIEVSPNGPEVDTYHCISKEKFERWFSVISELQTVTMEKGDGVWLFDARYHEHRRSDIHSGDTYLFNAISVRDLDVLNRVSFVKDERLYINLSSRSELYLCMPRYTTQDDSDPLSSVINRESQPVEDLVEGERYDIKVGCAPFAHTTYGNISETTAIDEIRIDKSSR